MYVRELFRHLRKHYNLSNNECVLYYEIYCLYFYGGKETCYASNEYFTEELGLSDGTIKRTLRHLQEVGLLKVHYDQERGFITRRHLFPLHDSVLLEKAKEIKEEREEKIHGDHNGDHNADQSDRRDADHFEPLIIDNYNNIYKDKGGSFISHSADVSNKQSVFKEDPKPKWNDLASRYHLPSINNLTTTRIRHLKARIKEAGGEAEFWAAVEGSLAASPFLKGENNRGWRANFDFFMQQSSFQKVLEGAYRQEGGPRQNSELTEQEKSLKALDDYIAKLKAMKNRD